MKSGICLQIGEIIHTIPPRLTLHNVLILPQLLYKIIINIKAAASLTF